ncbi:MAG: family 43 glycosylhydrolase [Clostridia bacterium]|nr:family 43 glycosylhydrolase [Clostridia bacterium]
MSYNSIRPGQEWLDTNGKPIQAHGFQVFYDEKNARYIWYGENKETTKKGGTDWTRGIRWYTSKDLYNWTDMGFLIPPSDDLLEPLHPTYCIDRPHILYCEKTGKYVAWIKVMASEIAQFMIVLQAERFEGPYTYVHKFYNPLDMYCGDFALHADSETKKAYIWYERPHFQLICATLSDTYTEVTDEYSVHYDGLTPPDTREAPTFFTRNGKKYLFTSGTSGYYPNKSDVCMFDDYHGEYKSLGDPHIGDKSDTSFSSQITSVLRIPGTDRYIACADRWMPQWYVKPMAKAIQNGMRAHFKDYTPDTEPKHITSVPGQLQKHGENTYKSRYVWLPIEWEGEKPVIRWQKEWTV